MSYVNTLSSFQKRFQVFVTCNFGSGRSLGIKVLFSTSLGQPKYQQFSDFLCIFMLSFSQTFLNNLVYASTLNAQEVIVL